MNLEVAENYVWKTPEELAVPIAGQVTVYLDSWWLTDSEGRVAFWNPPVPAGRRPTYGREYGAPQCNSNKRIGELRCNGSLFTGLVQLPIVFVPLDIGNY
ncbi:hypothetical protein KHQ84_gp116 [Rhodococcus phage Finch]|uniref:Uncharacterized protein n=1 Tax=Rhodococcus phage Finch TaxID=2094144 RepID=A0A2P1JXH2_9CAUD|nr:hypothetical protein KHQ84_gp116 [Rhodococcus phage Finch]AVO25047.1 hypothetical protein SEA_FINCH_116 [Rhodococcus phage Finch]